MSLATLKKKTQAKYRNASVNMPQFSIVGPHRNQGYVGQTSLTRSLLKTIAKGTTTQGYGGCCGTYPITPPILSGVYSTENSNVVKKSTMSTSGLLATKFRWLRRPYPFSNTKPDTNHFLQNSSDYIDYLKKVTIQNTDNLSCAKNHYHSINTCETTKDEKDIVAKTQGEYIIELHKNCADYDLSYILYSRSMPSIPFSCGF